MWTFFPKLVFLNIFFFDCFVVRHAKIFADDFKKKKLLTFFFYYLYIFLFFLHSTEMHFDLVTEKIQCKTKFSSPRNFGLLKKSENNFCIGTYISEHPTSSGTKNPIFPNFRREGGWGVCMSLFKMSVFQTWLGGR